MPWVQRDISGVICGCFANQQPGYAEEFLPNTNTDVLAFLNPPAINPVDRMDVITLKIMFNHENRIRVLETKAPITVAQFIAAIKAMP
jgi:hypothetical protein